MSDHGLTIEWSDGLRESYQLISQGDYGTNRTYVDKRGGIWKFNVHLQGNVSMKNTKNGNTIFKPFERLLQELILHQVISHKHKPP